MIKLKDFTEEDWMGFAGCEAEKPLIGDVSLSVDNKKIDGLVIVDKDDVIMYFDEFEGLEDSDDLNFRLEVNQKIGKFVVEHMSETFDQKYLEDIGFICEADLH